MRKGLADAQIATHLGVLREALNDVFALWANNYRYASEERLLAHLKRLTGFRKVKGDYLKFQAHKFLDAVEKFIEKAVVQWPFSGN